MYVVQHPRGFQFYYHAVFDQKISGEISNGLVIVINPDRVLLLDLKANGTYLRVARDFCPSILAPILSFPRCRRGRDRGKKLRTLAPSLAHEMRGGGLGWGQGLK